MESSLRWHGAAIVNIHSPVGSKDIGLGSKQILIAIGTAKQDENVADRFAAWVTSDAIAPTKVVWCRWCCGGHHIMAYALARGTRRQESALLDQNRALNIKHLIANKRPLKTMCKPCPVATAVLKADVFVID